MSRLKNILDIVSATGEESDSILAELLKPENMTREQAQEMFEDAVGYDPTSYFDKKDIENHINSLMDDDNTPDDVVSVISEDVPGIVDSAFDKFDESRQEYLEAAVADVIYEATGWDSSIEDDGDDEEESDDDEDYED